METRAHFILIGAFTLFVMFAAALFVLWLGKFSDQEYAYYDVVFEEPVTGLSEGGAVQYNGIQVGEVHGLRLDADNPARVVARVRAVANTPIKEDTRAQLGFMGVTGVAFIQLSGGSPGSPRLQPEEGQQVAVIVADVSNLQRLLEGGGDVFANVNDLLVRLNRVFADENIARLSATISHVEQVSASLADERESLEQMLRDGAAVAASLERVLGRVEGMTADVESVVSEMDEAITAHVQGLFADARHSAAELRRFSARLDELAAHTQPQLERFSGEGLDQIVDTMNRLSRLSRRLEQIAQRFEENPSRFIFNSAAPREYEPEE